MRNPVDGGRIRALAKELARVTRQETTLYLTGAREDADAVPEQAGRCAEGRQGDLAGPAPDRLRAHRPRGQAQGQGHGPLRKRQGVEAHHAEARSLEGDAQAPEALLESREDEGVGQLSGRPEAQAGERDAARPPGTAGSPIARRAALAAVRSLSALGW